MVSSPTGSLKKADFHQVVEALEQFCAKHAPGDRIPTRTDLMQRFNASERTVLRAIDELRREGKITTRTGAGTYVSESFHSAPTGTVNVAPNQNLIVAIGPRDYSFFDRCMHLLLRQTEDAELTLVCQFYDANDDSHRAFFEWVQPSGVILFRYDLAPLAKQLQDAGHRVVIVGTPPTDVTPEVPCVYGDHEVGGYLIARHLLDLGHRHLAYYDPGSEWQQTLRWRGTQKAIREAQRTGTANITCISRAEMASWQQNPSLTGDYFRRPDAPTGVVAWNDHEALILLATLQRAGIKVPEQVSIVGYDDLPESLMVHPRLTTVNHAIEQQLQAAISIVTRPIAPPTSHTVVVLPTIVSRDSATVALRGIQ